MECGWVGGCNTWQGLNSGHRFYGIWQPCTCSLGSFTSTNTHTQRILKYIYSTVCDTGLECVVQYIYLLFCDFD